MAPKRNTIGYGKKNLPSNKDTGLKGGTKGKNRSTRGLSTGVATTSKEPPVLLRREESKKRRCLKFIYNKETKELFGRTVTSWLLIISYTVIYMMFLITFTLLFLFVILFAYKNSEYSVIDKTALLTYADRGVGLSATPTSEFSYPMIWYRMGNENDYEKYVSAIDRLLISRRNTNYDYSYLGPCSKAPYGYGNNPCVIIRINRQLKWTAKPLRKNSTKAADAPSEVKEWLRTSDKLWLHCDGYHSYDKEHIDKIKYFPNPPGFDPNSFPLDIRNQSPLVAVQISGFAKGISLAIQCNLWYEDGPSSIEFMLYVESPSLGNTTGRKRERENFQ